MRRPAVAEVTARCDRDHKLEIASGVFVAGNPTKTHSIRGANDGEDLFERELK
jgi:hypothetical protein